MNDKRFVLIENNDEFPNNGRTCWWWDTERPLENALYQPYVAVQQYVGTDPNNYVRHAFMMVLFTDQAEYYVVCEDCYQANKGKQWSGSKKNPNWESDSHKTLRVHIKTKGWCEFCDPVFGNGGWE
jgi:hypothetical protein